VVRRECLEGRERLHLKMGFGLAVGIDVKILKGA
jgi:hypothetical protein